MNTTTTTFRRSLTRSLVQGAVWLMIASGLLFAGASGLLSESPSVDVYGGQSYPEQVAADHGCGDLGGALPTGVVLTYDGAVAAEFTTNRADVRAAFEFAVGERDSLPKRIDNIVAFCA